MGLPRSSRKYQVIALAIILIGGAVAIPLVVSRDGHGIYEPLAFESPDDLAEWILECLQEGDVEGFASACISADEMIALMDATGAPWEDLEKAEDKFKPGGKDRMIGRARNGFKLVMNQQNWEEADLERVEFETRIDDGVSFCTEFVMQVEIAGEIVPVNVDRVIKGLDGWKVLYNTGLGVDRRNSPSIRLHACEVAAIATLRNISSAQAQFQATARADNDGDCAGEFGSFRELSGSIEIRGDREVGKLNPPVLSGAFRSPNRNGYVSRSGYFFVIYLPNAKGTAVCADADGFENVDADLAETTWCAYAWPVSYGSSGNRSFMVNQTGDVATTESKEYSSTNGPKPDAAFLQAGSGDQSDPSADGCIISLMAVGTKGRDGNTWRQVN